jgi:hypothetical protein
MGLAPLMSQPSGAPLGGTSSIEAVVNRGQVVLPLGRGINAEPKTYEGLLRVDIRHWTDENIRTRKGISLPLQCWQELLNTKPQVQEAVEKMKQNQAVCECYHLGNSVYATVNSPLWIVDIRYWWKDQQDGVLKPGRRGIGLKFPEFSELMDYTCIINEKLTALQQQMITL